MRILAVTLLSFCLSGLSAQGITWENVEDNGMPIRIESYAALSSKPKPGFQVRTLMNGDTVYLVDYKRSFYKIKSKIGNGYVAESWLADYPRAKAYKDYKGGNTSLSIPSAIGINKVSKESTIGPGKSKTGRSYIRGPRGGCYYINSNGNKTYVARSLCN